MSDLVLRRAVAMAERWVRESALDSGLDEDVVAHDVIRAFVDLQCGGRETELGREVLRVTLGA